MIFELAAVALLIVLLTLLYQLKQRKIQLGYRILLSLCMGIAYGLFLKLVPQYQLLLFIRGFLRLLGTGYLDLLKMLVIPLILTSLIHAILNLGYEKSDSIKKMSFFTCVLLLLMTSAASLVGMLIGKIFNVGEGMQLPALAIPPEHTYTGLVDTLLGMIPTNPVAVMSSGNSIAVVIFAVLLGISARMLDEADHELMITFKKWISSLFAIVKKLAVFILGITPYGILALMSSLVLDQGIALLDGMIHFMIAMYVAMIIVLIMHCVILLMVGENPWHYLQKAYTPLFVAFTTRSSFATLPVTEETLRHKLNTSQMTATFVPSIGATIGMNACAGIFPAMLVVMTLTIMHQPLTSHMILMVMVINAIASLGISGIPGTAYIAATVTLTSLNLPYAIVGLVQGIDPLIDMGRTATNVSGAMTTALVVDKVVITK